MDDLKYNPNIYYYDKRGGKVHLFREGNRKLADLGKRLHMPCGGQWILGKGFAFCIEFAANTYDYLQRVIECGPLNIKKWNELELHLCQVESCLHTLKSRNACAKMLGLR